MSNIRVVDPDELNRIRLKKKDRIRPSKKKLGSDPNKKGNIVKVVKVFLPFGRALVIYQRYSTVSPLYTQILKEKFYFK